MIIYLIELSTVHPHQSMHTLIKLLEADFNIKEACSFQLHQVMQLKCLASNFIACRKYKVF